MTSQLADTNVISELARERPNSGVVAWSSRVSGIALSVISLEEIWFGLGRKPNPRILAWFEAFIARSVQVIDVMAATARAAGILRRQLAARGLVRTQADMLIAATASVGGFTLVTRNSRDFEGCGIAVLNPFT